MSGHQPPRPLILASTSRYRKDLLARFQVPFEVHSPEVDETPQPDEPPDQLAMRLARAKAWAIARRYPGAVVIGSDQVAALGPHLLGKPGDRATARKQLTLLSAQVAIFHTAVCVTVAESNQEISGEVPTWVRFRKISADEIERYLEREDALDCAGSAKSEGLGISLLEAVQSEDPTALIGLPLIRLGNMLRTLGLSLP